MKQIVLILSLLLFSGHLKAPDRKDILIIQLEPVNYYTPLISAVVTTESDNLQTAYNEKEIAVSYFQIRPVRLRDFNKKTGKRYVMADMYIYDRAKEVFMYYCNNRSYEQVARGWAGGDYATKEATDKYWKKVNAKL